MGEEGMNGDRAERQKPFPSKTDIYKEQALPNSTSLTWLHSHYMEYLNYHIFLLVIQLLHFRTRNLTDLSL